MQFNKIRTCIALISLAKNANATTYADKTETETESGSSLFCSFESQSDAIRELMDDSIPEVENSPQDGISGKLMEYSLEEQARVIEANATSKALKKLESNIQSSITDDATGEKNGPKPTFNNLKAENGNLKQSKSFDNDSTAQNDSNDLDDQSSSSNLDESSRNTEEQTNEVKLETAQSKSKRTLILRVGIFSLILVGCLCIFKTYQ